MDSGAFLIANVYRYPINPRVGKLRFLVYHCNPANYSTPLTGGLLIGQAAYYKNAPNAIANGELFNQCTVLR